jgi:hypothetical protein
MKNEPNAVVKTRDKQHGIFNISKKIQIINFSRKERKSIVIMPMAREKPRTTLEYLCKLRGGNNF